MRLFLIMMAMFIGVSASACPLGAKEDHLTIQRVMRNFGRFIMPAESIAYGAQNKNEVITDAQLQEAIEKLSLVISCANAVLENPTGDLLPTSARQLSGAELAQYLDTFTFFMDEFKLSVTDYQSAFIKIQAQPADKRDFSSLLQLTQNQDSFIQKAHKKLMGD